MASFGPEPEMQIPGRVAVWSPPRRVVFDGGEDVGGLAFEWLVEPASSDSCIVRLNNTGFGDGAEWDDQYDDMTKGWQLFMLNLKLHLQHFKGQTAASSLPMTMWAGPADAAWATLTGELGISASPGVGDRIEVAAADAPSLAGTVVEAASQRIALILDTPSPGTGFIVVEGGGEMVVVSIWAYLYGDEGAEAAQRDEPRWRAWLAKRSPQGTDA